MLAESSRTTLEATLLDRTLPLVPGLVERLEAGIAVADVGCGAGVAILLMVERFPRSRFTGFDISTEAIAMARVDASRLGLMNAQFIVEDAAQITARSAF